MTEYHFPDFWRYNMGIYSALVAFAVSFFTSMCGVSGAFVLLPFQMSVLNYSSASVSGTNQLFNIIAIPSGVWRYVKEKRMVWTVIIGTLPGVLIGVWVCLEYLYDARDRGRGNCCSFLCFIFQSSC